MKIAFENIPNPVEEEYLSRISQGSELAETKKHFNEFKEEHENLKQEEKKKWHEHFHINRKSSASLPRWTFQFQLTASKKNKEMEMVFFLRQ